MNWFTNYTITNDKQVNKKYIYKHYKKKSKVKYAHNNNKTTMIKFIDISKRRLQEHLSDCLRCHIKGKAKQATELVKVQSVLCEESNRGLKISVTKICRTIV